MCTGQAAAAERPTVAEECEETSQEVSEDVKSSMDKPTIFAEEKYATDHGNNDLLYNIDEVPPWYTCAALGFQQFLTMLNGAVAMPLLVTPLVCMADDDPARGYVVGATLFVSGITTLLQTTLGTRLPIVQGPSWTYLAPITAVMQLPQWQCPAPAALDAMAHEQRRQLWQPRMCELFGALAVASVVQLLLGLTGSVGLLLRFISPITIVCTITVLGIGFFSLLRNMMASFWPISMLTLCLVVMFSQYLKNATVPFPVCTTKKMKVIRVPIFKLLPILLSILISWGICAILTYTDVLQSGSAARTDTNVNAVSGADWFRLPLPGQWGAPTVHLGALLGMTAGVLASVIESIGDYYACAKMAGALPPPVHAINRGIAVEGLGGILSGLFGTGNASTSYSGNIGIIGVTRVGSRRVVQWSAVLMILFGTVGKFGALFVSIPLPVYGGAFLPLFAMVAGMGLSALQHIDLNSTRNVFIIGLSIIISLVVPGYVEKNADVVRTGYPMLDQVIYVLLSTAMFLAGLVSGFLDNTLPGSDEERGMTKWKAQTRATVNVSEHGITYDLPFGMNLIKSWRWTRHLPFSPTFAGFETERLTSCWRRAPEPGTDPGADGVVLEKAGPLSPV